MHIAQFCTHNNAVSSMSMYNQHPSITDLLRMIQGNTNAQTRVEYLTQLVEALKEDPILRYNTRQELLNIFQSSMHTLIERDCYEKLPFPIAYTFEQANKHSYEPLIQLLFLFDALEVTLRWCCGYGLALLEEQYSNGVPDYIMYQIQDNLTTPSFGQWLHIARVVFSSLRIIPQKERTQLDVWYSSIIQKRNNIAHGSFGGDVQPILEATAMEAKQVLQWLCSVHENYDVVLVSYDIEYDCTGITLHPPKNTLQCGADGNGIYVVNKSTMSVHRIQHLFLPSEKHSTPPIILSMMGSDGVKKNGKNAVLKYVQINGSDVEMIHDDATVSSFIRYFKTNHQTLATQPWEVELKKWASSLDQAWSYDIDLIKSWRKTRYQEDDKERSHILWFGGGSEQGKSTILNSAANKLNNHKNNIYCFVYSFENATISSIEDAKKSLNHFLLQLRQAINFWTQKDASTIELDHTIRDVSLRKDIVTRIASFLSIKQVGVTKSKAFPCICIAIDDVHSLQYQEVYMQLREHLVALKTPNNQVLCMLTGISTMVQQSIPSVFTNTHPSIDWLYDIVRIQTCSVDLISTDVPHSRYVEICHHYQHQQYDKGSTMPTVQETGIMGIITHMNKMLNVELSLQHPFIKRVKELAQNRPRYADVVAKQLRENQINIHDTLENTMVLQGYFSQRFQSQSIGDIQRVLAFVLCALEQHGNIPLTTEALQMLHDKTTIPHPQSIETIQAILLQSQGLLDVVNMNTVSRDGNVQYGWKLGSAEIADVIRNNSVNSILFHTHKEAKENTQWLKRNYANIVEGTQLKDIYAPLTPNITDFTKIFRSIRGKMIADIMDLDVPSSHAHVYKNVKNRLWKTSMSGQVHISWLQIGTEYAKTSALYTEAQQFLHNSTFADLWLTRLNAPHLPFCEHQRGAYTSTEKASNLFALGNDYFIIRGESAYVLSSVSQAKEECVLYTHPLDDRGKSIVVDEYFVEEDGVGYLVVALPYSVITMKITVANGVVVTSHTQEFGNKEKILGVLQRSKTCILHGTLAEALEWDPIIQSVVRRWTYPTGTPQKDAYFILSDHWGYRVGGKKATLHVFSIASPIAQSFPLTTGSNSPLPILDGDQRLVKYGAIGGTNENSDCVVWDIAQGECILTQGISKVVALFDVFDGILSVHIDGTVTHHPYGKSATESISLQELLSKHTDYIEKIREDRFNWRLKGALFYENKLVVYGDSQLVVGLEIHSGDLHKAKILPFPQLHYGMGQSAITNIQIVSTEQVSADFLSKHNISIHKTGYTSLAISQSFDNDIRLWNLDTQKCIGLCRGLGDKVFKMLIAHNHVIGVDQSKNVIIWEFNDGMSAQLQASPQRQGGYISFAYRYGDELVVMDNNNQIGKFANQGADWSVDTSYMYSAVPTTPPVAVKECIPCQRNIVCVVGKSLYTVDVSSCVWTKTPLVIKANGETEIELNIDRLFSLESSSLAKPTEFLVRGYFDATYYLLLLGEDGTIIKWVSTPKFTSLYTTGLDNIWICSTTETTMKEIYVVNWNGQHTQICACNSSQQIEGFYVFDTKILAWAKPTMGKSTPLFYAEKKGERWQFCTMNGSDMIQHNSCMNVPQNVLLAKDGLYFSITDEDQIWWIYPNENEDGNAVSITTEPIEDFIVNHHEKFFERVAPMRKISNANVSAMVFSVSYGLNLYLQHSSWGDMQQLVWLGMLSKTHRVLELLPNGRIIAVRNREVMVLQLMKGSKAVDFSNFHL